MEMFVRLPLYEMSERKMKISMEGMNIKNNQNHNLKIKISYAKLKRTENTYVWKPDYV